MSDKAEKKPDAAASAEKKDAAKPAAAAAAGGHADAKGGGGIGALLGKTPVMLGGVMLLEAVVLFAGMKFLGGSPKPAAAAGAELVAGAGEAAEKGDAKSEGQSTGAEHPAKGAASSSSSKVKEVEVLSFRAPNKLSGRTFLYDVSIYAVCKNANEPTVASAIKDRKNLISDRIRTIIAQTDPEKLGGGSEPGLETLRRQVKYQLDQIVGEGLIDEVLVPRCIPFRTDF